MTIQALTRVNNSETDRWQAVLVRQLQISVYICLKLYELKGQ